MLIFEALTVDRADFRALTVDFAIIYGRMHSDSTPSLVYGLTECGHSCDCGAYWSDLPLPYPQWMLILVTTIDVICMYDAKSQHPFFTSFIADCSYHKARVV